jgi:hypothetical protein
MHMDLPIPFNYASLKRENAPINSASQFPCNPTNLQTFENSGDNSMKVGEPQKLKIGGAVGGGATHGGGSCQLSISTDEVPKDTSTWKVIKSFEGGCPVGNQPEGSEFTFELPASVPNGKVTLAWSWLAQITGEFYMNCAPLTVTGGANDASGLEKLPDMFVASKDVNEADCKFVGDVEFPNPGAVVEKGGEGKLVKPTGAGCTKVFRGKGVAVAAPQAASSATKAPTASSTSAVGGIFAPGASSAVSVLEVPATSTLTTLTTVAATPAVPEVPTQTVGTAPAIPMGTGTPCPTDGIIVCSGTEKFGLCNHGKVVWQAVSAGTQCQNGKVVKRDFHPVRRGRVMRPRFRHSHL